MEQLIEILIICLSGLSIALITTKGVFDFIPIGLNWLSEQFKNRVIVFVLDKLNELATCSKCIAGQLALIHSVAEGFNFNKGFYYVTLSIFFTYIIQKVIDKWE